MNWKSKTSAHYRIARSMRAYDFHLFSTENRETVQWVSSCLAQIAGLTFSHRYPLKINREILLRVAINKVRWIFWSKTKHAENNRTMQTQWQARNHCGRTRINNAYVWENPINHSFRCNIFLLPSIKKCGNDYTHGWVWILHAMQKL